MKCPVQDFDFIFKFEIPLPEFASKVNLNRHRNMEQHIDTVPICGGAYSIDNK
jgi:hypothetical protein